jgi:splicing factor 3B subunit 2
VDAQGIPIYGNVFDEAAQPQAAEVPVDRQLWGELEIEEYVSSDEEDSSDEEGSDEEEGEHGAGSESYDPMAIDGGIASVSAGLVTPDVMPTVRKLRGVPEGPPGYERPKELYQVLEQKHTSVDSSQMYGSTHTYVLPGGDNSGVQLSLDPSQLAQMGDGLDPQLLKQQYEQSLQQQQQQQQQRSGARVGHQDLSDVVAEETRKRKRGNSQSKEQEKKYKF